MLHLVYCSQRKSKLNLVHRNPRTSGPRGFQSNGELRRETPFGTSNSILSKKGHQKISIFCYFDWGMGDLKWGSDHFSGSFFYTYNHCSPSVDQANQKPGPKTNRQTDQVSDHCLKCHRILSVFLLYF